MKINFEKIKDLASIGGAQIIAAGISGIFFLYIASLLGDEDYGHVSYLFASANMIGTIALLGSKDVLIVFRAKDVKIQSTIFLIVVLASIICAIGSYFFIESTIVSIYIIGIVIFSLTISETLGVKNFKRYSLFVILQRVLGISLAVGFYFVIGLEGIILGYAIGYIPFGILGFVSCKNTPINFQMIKTRKKFMINSYAKSLMKTFVGQLDKIVIFPLFGAALLGNYSLGFQIFVLAGLLPGIIYHYTLPQESSGKSQTKLKKITVILTIFTSILTYFLAPTVLIQLFPRFEESVEIIQIMSFGITPFAISMMITSRLLANEKVLSVVIGQGIILIALISGIFILKDSFGIFGAAISFSISNFIGAIYYCIISKTSLLKNN
jgi:O-antigen/teichoic acid export membrane protein